MLSEERRARTGLADFLVRGFSGVLGGADGMRVLVPYGGDGSIVDATQLLNRTAEVTVLALDAPYVAQYAARARCELGVGEVGEHQGWRFDAVVMDPPLPKVAGDEEWLDAALKAWTMVAPDGRLVCVAPPAWRTGEGERHERFRSLVGRLGGSYDLRGTEFGVGALGDLTVTWMTRPGGASVPSLPS